MSGGLIHATHPWNDPDAWREDRTLGGGSNGQEGIARMAFPAADAPDLRVCLDNCPCADDPEVCENDLRCPFTPGNRRRRLERQATRTPAEQRKAKQQADWHKRRRERVRLASRSIRDTAMARAVKACRREG